MENPEVRYHMLRPDQVVARRKECPVVYIPLGNLEWHGVHNPVGADSLQAEGLAIRCAQKGGGLAFPPLYYGDNRSEALMEFNAADKDLIAAGYELPEENFFADKAPFTVMQQSLNYLNLLIHILAEAESLGFKVGTLITGHFPLIDHARAAVLKFNERPYSKYHGMLAWALIDAGLPGYPYRADHAGAWETSHLMALHPEAVDLNALPPRGERVVGAMFDVDPREASAAYGSETIDFAVDIAVREVKHRLEHPGVYGSSGRCLDEGLWKQED